MCVLSCVDAVGCRDKVEGLRGKEALVQAVVKNIARKEVKEPETRSDDELRVALRAKGKLTVKVRFGLYVVVVVIAPLYSNQ